MTIVDVAATEIIGDGALFHYPRRHEHDECSAPPLVAGREQAALPGLEPAGTVDRGERLDGADQSLALPHGVEGGVCGVGHGAGKYRWGPALCGPGQPLAEPSVGAALFS